MKKRLIFASVALIAAIVIVLVIIGLQTKAEYEAVFHSDSGEILAIEKVKQNETPSPPDDPHLTYGYIFKKWDTDFIEVKEDLDIYPETVSFTGKANVFALSGGYGSQEDAVYIPFVLRGEICLSGFSVSVNYDKDVLKLESVYDADGAVIFNKETEGIVHINYTSLENTVADVDICSFKFRIKEDVEKTDLHITMESICANKNDETFYTPENNLIDASVYVLPKKGGGGVE